MTAAARLSGRKRPRLPEAGTVDVWHVSLSAAACYLSALSAMLSWAELRAADRYVVSAHRRRAVMSRGLLRYMLGQYLEMPPSEVLIGVGEHGKPKTAHPLQFNVTHSGDMLAYAFCLGMTVGIDAERIDPGIDMIGLAGNVFSGSELQHFKALPHREQTKAFFACWTRKEALLKALGDGLTRPLRDIELAPDASLQPLLRSMVGYTIADVPLRDGYAVALATQSVVESLVSIRGVLDTV